MSEQPPLLCRVRGVGSFDMECGRPGAVPTVSICLHEHVEHSAACPDCLRDDLFCSLCHDVDGHDCLVVVRVMEATQ